MDIHALLTPANVNTSLAARDKAGLLRDLALRAASSLSLSGDRIFSQIMKREDLGTTGVGDGVAIPHVRLAEVEQPVGFLARLDDPINFDAVDGRPVDLVFLLLLPGAPTGGQLAALASVARALRDPERVARARAAADAQGVYLAMTSTPSAGQQPANQPE
jgi:PTS system nitrogen regulatory IIA component